MKKVVVVLSIILILAMGAGVVSYFSKGFADWQPFQPLIDLFTPAAAEVEVFDGGLLEAPVDAWTQADLGGEGPEGFSYYYSTEEFDLSEISEESVPVLLTCKLDGVTFTKAGLFNFSTNGLGTEEETVEYNIMALDGENPIIYAGTVGEDEEDGSGFAGGWFSVSEMPDGAETMELTNRFVIMALNYSLDDHTFEIIKLELAA